MGPARKVEWSNVRNGTHDWVIGQIRIWRGPTLPNAIVSSIGSMTLIVGGIFGIVVSYMYQRSLSTRMLENQKQILHY